MIFVNTYRLEMLNKLTVLTLKYENLLLRGKRGKGLRTVCVKMTQILQLLKSMEYIQSSTS